MRFGLAARELVGEAPAAALLERWLWGRHSGRRLCQLTSALGCGVWPQNGPVAVSVGSRVLLNNKVGFSQSLIVEFTVIVLILNSMPLNDSMYCSYIIIEKSCFFS